MEKKIDLKASAMWGASFTHDRFFSAGIWQETMEYQHYVFFIPSASYKLFENSSISLSAFHGYGFPEGSIRWATFVSLAGNIPRLNLGKLLYAGLFPQLLFINLDWETAQFFIAGKFGIGLKKFPLFLSTQISQSLAGDLSPNPG